MGEIRQLSPSMINKIAAGEVIERPANVVKELVENSIDAGATRIEVAIENNGMSLIRVVDDGCGIAAEQILLALSPHATSKIQEAEDLFQIGTLGFRGEALASIAEVTQLLFRSRPENANEGTEIRSDGGQFSAPIPCGMPRGTLIEVRNLFFNIPVRRKFLKSPTTEFGHISEVMTRMALGHPEIHFLFKHNGRIIADLPPTSNWEQRIRKQFGGEIADRLIHVVSNRNGLKIDGFVSHPDLSRPNNSMQYLFLNGRFIKDRSLQHALGEAYRGLLGVGRFPLAFVQMEVPPDFVDVNVHPMKLEVRFVNSGTVYSGFLGAIREEFLQSDLRSHPTNSQSNELNEPSESHPFGQSTTGMNPLPRHDDPRSAMDEGVAANIRDRISAWTQGIATGSNSMPTDFSPSELPNRSPLPSQSVPAFTPFPSDGFRSGGSRPPLTLNRIGHSSGLSAIDSSVPARQCDNTIADSPIVENNRPSLLSTNQTIQIHQRYLVTQTEEGMAIIDQHALHERLLYERIRAKMEQGRLDSQRLLVPIPVDLTPLEAVAAIENRELLADLGLLIDPFGGNTLLINGAPVILPENDPVITLHILLATLMESGKKSPREALLEEMMHQMACKAAVKAGESLTPELIEELIAQARQEQQSHHCPHGRPSILIWSCQELDKMFKRL